MSVPVEGEQGGRIDLPVWSLAFAEWQMSDEPTAAQCLAGENAEFELADWAAWLVLDFEPLTEEWLMSIGFEWRGRGKNKALAHKARGLEALPLSQPNKFAIGCHDKAGIFNFVVTSRRNVLRALLALSPKME